MTLDPALLEILAALPTADPDSPSAVTAADPTGTRAAIDAAADEVARRMTAAGPEVGVVTEVSIAVSGGQIAARLYEPAGAGPFGAHVYLHGGSFTQGSPASLYVDATCRERCAAAGVIVLSVDYRMAPEHQFPVAVLDSYAALCWLRDNSSRLRIDPANLSIGGGSAGANLAAAVTVHARAEGGPALRLALLEVPALDLTGGHVDRSLPPALGDPDALLDIFGVYLGDRALSREPLPSPLLVDDLTGLPPFHVMTAELDPLRGDGEAFLARLHESGVAATGGRRAGHVHMSPSFTAVFEPARQWRSEVLSTLATAHAPTQR